MTYFKIFMLMTKVKIFIKSTLIRYKLCIFSLPNLHSLILIVSILKHFFVNLHLLCEVSVFLYNYYFLSFQLKN